MPHELDWTVIIVSLGTVLINGLFAFLTSKFSKNAGNAAISAQVHADKAIQASLRPRFGDPNEHEPW